MTKKSFHPEKAGTAVPHPLLLQVLTDPEPQFCEEGTAPGVRSNPNWGLRTTLALTWGKRSGSVGEATSCALGQGEPLEPHTATWNTSFRETFGQKQSGSLTLVVLKIYDKMVLTMLLWSLLGLINQGGLSALFVQDCNSSILSVLGFPGLAWWPNHIASVGKGSWNLETSEYAFFYTLGGSYTVDTVPTYSSWFIYNFFLLYGHRLRANTNLSNIYNLSNSVAGFLMLSCVHSSIH